VFGAPFCFSRVSLGKLASFPESESCSGAKSEAKLRKSARYRVFSRCARVFPQVYEYVYPQNTRYFADLADLAPKQPQTRLSPEKWMVSPWSFPRNLEGAVGKLAGNTEETR